MLTAHACQPRAGRAATLRAFNLHELGVAKLPFLADLQNNGDRQLGEIKLGRFSRVVV